MSERVIVVGCQLPGVPDHVYEESVAELEALVTTAHGVVVGRLDQKRQAIDRRTFIGKGKVEELVALADELEPDLIIFNAEVTPGQMKNIRIALSDPEAIKLIDRTQLILDIFAGRAQSREGKLQVELAQMSYLLPRLAGQGTQLSRLGGGIGTRGPGESKLETDRRHIRRRFETTRDIRRASCPLPGTSQREPDVPNRTRWLYECWQIHDLQPIDSSRHIRKG